MTGGPRPVRHGAAISRGARFAIAVTPVTIALGMATATVVLAMRAPGGPVDAESGFGAVAIVLAAFTYVVVAAVLVVKVGDNPVGWLLGAYGFGLLSSLFGSRYAARALAGQRLPGAAVVGWEVSWGWALGVLALGLALLLFPDGRLPSARWRWLLLAAAAAAGAWLIVAARLWPYRDPALYGPGGYPAGVDGLVAVATPMVIVVFAACGASVLVRFRGSRGEERQQLKWLLSATALVAVGLGAVGVTGVVPEHDAPVWIELLLLAGILAIPLAVAIAVLRYRLYDIDRLISRTMIYGLVTVILAGVYAGGVVLIGALLRPLTAESQWPVAASTLAVAAAFGPVRRRVQSGVDRRFNRARYDATLTGQQFSARLRDEMDLDALASQLETVAAYTVQPTHVSIWLRTPEARR